MDNNHNKEFIHRAIELSRKASIEEKSGGVFGAVVVKDGKIIAGGRAYLPGTGYDFALARYDTSGALDSSFDNDGLVTTDFFGLGDEAYDLVLQDTKLVAAGTSCRHQIEDGTGKKALHPAQVLHQALVRDQD